MQQCHPVTFELFIDDEALLAQEDLAVDLLSDQFGITNWNPWVPNPPPITQNRVGSQLVPRSPVRLAMPPSRGPGGQFDQPPPEKQDRRQTRNTEILSMIVNALLRRADIICVGTQDYRLSWLIPEYAGVDAPVGTLFLDTTTGLLSLKDINGVIIPIGSGGTISLDFGGP